MKLSARNQLKGKIVAVTKGQTTAHIRIDIGGGTDLGNHEQVELAAGLLDHIDDVAIHVRGVEAVDAHRNRLVAPVDIMQRGDRDSAAVPRSKLARSACWAWA